MSTDTATTPDTTETTETTLVPTKPSIKDRAAQVAKATAFAGAVADHAARLRNELDLDLLERYADDGTPSVVVKDDVGEKMVTFTVVQPQAKDVTKVTDEAAFFEWVLANYPGEIETVPQVRASFRTVILGRTVLTDGVLFDKETGEPFPDDAGITNVHTAAGEANSTTTKWNGNAVGKQKALDMMLADADSFTPAELTS